MFAADSLGARIEPTPGARAVCTGCKSEVLAKCGSINVWHWAHVTAECDPWHEPESEWHRAWKLAADPDQREVVIGPHRADIVGRFGTVIELQHSAISIDEIREREAFYAPRSPHGMIWLFDAGEWAGRVGIEPTNYSDVGPTVRFDWAHARPSHKALRNTVFWDLEAHFRRWLDAAPTSRHAQWLREVAIPTPLLRIENFAWESRGGWGILFKRSEFVDSHIRLPRQGSLL